MALTCLDVDANALGSTPLSVTLRPWANQVAQRYGHPVYLVGSAIEQGQDARDIDVVCVLPHREFVARFGHNAYDLTTKWSSHMEKLGTELGKLSAYASGLLRLNIDLKVQGTAEAFRFKGRPMVRIDSLLFEEVTNDGQERDAEGTQ